MPSRPTCAEHKAGDVHEGWGDTIWDIPLTATDPKKYQLLDEDGVPKKILLTPNTTWDARWAKPVKIHAKTKRTYPDGFFLEVEFKFDPGQIPIFPSAADAVAKHGHRPTFLGNSGVGIYRWKGNEFSKYLYEVQVADTAGMSDGNVAITHENRFVRLDYDPTGAPYGATWTKRKIKNVLPATILTDEQALYNPSLDLPFKAVMAAGGADNLCAIVAGNPISYFKDIALSSTPPANNKFPQPGVALSSVIALGHDSKPIGGSENPLQMYWGNRADYVPKGVGPELYKHFNKTDSSLWNKLEVCFLPARYVGTVKKLNAYIHSTVNENLVFAGEIKSGTRGSSHRVRADLPDDPEPIVYTKPQAADDDFKIRLLGHWGSKVYYRKIKIKSVGSLPPPA